MIILLKDTNEVVNYVTSQTVPNIHYSLTKNLRTTARLGIPYIWYKSPWLICI